MSTSSTRFTSTRSARVCALLAREYVRSFNTGTLDLHYERPMPRVPSLCTAPIELPAYPGVIGRTFEGTLTLAREVPVSYRRACTTH
jgi:hypothetical protein